MSVLVLGGTRFNGLALVRALLAAGEQVTVLNRGRTPATLADGVERLVADRDDPASMAAALAGRTFDAVCDLSGYTLPQVRTVVELMTGATGHLVFASTTVCHAATRVLPIRASSPDEEGPAQNDYARAKMACERHVLDAHHHGGPPATVVRFPMVFGPNNIVRDREQRMFTRLLRGRPVLIPGDGTAIGMVSHVDDQAEALCRVLGAPVTFGRRYDLAGRDCFTDDGYVDVFAEVTGTTPRRVHVPAPIMDELWARQPALDPPAHLIQRLGPNIHHWSANVFFSAEELRVDVGWEPTRSLRAMVAEAWDWYRREGLQDEDFDFSLEDELLGRLA